MVVELDDRVELDVKALLEIILVEDELMGSTIDALEVY